MESKNILNIAIVLTVGVILAGSLLMPVISDATATEDTYTNNGVIYLEKYTTESPDVTIVWDHTNPAAISVNEEEITLPDTVPYLSIDMGNNWFIRYTRDAQRMSFISSDASIAANVTDGTDLTVTLIQGAVSATNGTQNSTDTYDEYLCITTDINSGYIMKASDSTVKMNGDSEFYAYGVTGQYGFKLTGSIDDGVTVTTIRGGSPTISEETIDYTADDKHQDLYTLDKITFKYGSTLATYNMFVVPNVVTAERTQHLDNGEIALINIIPVMVIVALLMVAVGGLYLRRND